MKELKNLVTVTGKLVKNNIEEFKTKKGVDAIGGSLVLRTADNSEHEINFYANKYKKNENKEFTTEESYFYKQYMDAKNNLKDIEHCSETKSTLNLLIKLSRKIMRVQFWKLNLKQKELQKRLQMRL